MSAIVTLCVALAVLFLGRAYECLGLFEGLEKFLIDIKRVILLSSFDSVLETKLFTFLLEGCDALTQEFDALLELERVLIPVVVVLVRLDFFEV